MIKGEGRGEKGGGNEGGFERVGWEYRRNGCRFGGVR